MKTLPIPRAAVPALAALGALTLLAFVLIVALFVGAPPSTAQPSDPPPPVGVIATPTPQPGLGQAINAYGAPDQASYIGPVEAGRAYTVVAISDDMAWLQLDVVGSGLVWTTVESVHGVDSSVLPIIARIAPTALPPPPAPPAATPAAASYDPAPAAPLCTADTCDPQTAPTVCAADMSGCWSAAAPTVVRVNVPVENAQGQKAETESAPPERVNPATFADPGCSPFVGYLPGSPCFRGGADEAATPLPRPGERGFVDSFK